MSAKSIQLPHIYILGIILVFAGAIYLFQTTQQETNSILSRLTSTGKIISTSSKPAQFTSAKVHLSFSYPRSSSYVETEPLLARKSTGLNLAGKQVQFNDANNINPSFNTTTTDFSAEDSIPHDILQGTLDSTSSFSIATFEKTTQIVKEISPGMFMITAYGNIECSPEVSSFLFVRPPTGSGLKYISFYLGGNSFTDSEIGNTCRPQSDVISKHLTSLTTSSTVLTVLPKAIAIAKTFKTN